MYKPHTDTKKPPSSLRQVRASKSAPQLAVLAMRGLSATENNDSMISIGIMCVYMHIIIFRQRIY